MPQVVVCAVDLRSTLLLLQALQKWQLGFLVSLYLLGPEFSPTAHTHCYFQSGTDSLYFVVPGEVCLLLLLLSCFSRVQLCATPEMAAHQALPSLGFSRQEY